MVQSKRCSGQRSPSARHPQPWAAVRVHQLLPNSLHKGDGFGPIQNLQDLAAMASQGRYRCNPSWWEDGAEFRASVCWGCSEGKVATQMSLCWRVLISQPPSFQCCSNRLLFISFPGLCHNINHSDFQLSSTLSSPLKLEQTTHISMQAATGDTVGKKKTHIKRQADFLYHHPPSLLRLLIYGDGTPVFRLSTCVQTETHMLSAWCRKWSKQSRF